MYEHAMASSITHYLTSFSHAFPSPPLLLPFFFLLFSSR